MSELDQAALQRALDITKSTVFLKSNAAFLGSLMCSLEFIWDETIETAQTDGVHLWWNPHWFLSLPPRTRETVLVHELWHPGKLHELRRGSRDPKIWNYACVSGETQVAMADGTQKAIRDIDTGDRILNVRNGTSVVAVKINSGYKDILELHLESGRILKCTAEHRILTHEGFARADTLTTGVTCFVDSRHGAVSERQLENQDHAGDRRSTGDNLSSGRVQGIHAGIDSHSQAHHGYTSATGDERSGMGLPGWIDRRGGNHHHRAENDQGQAVSPAQAARHQHLSTDAGLVGSTGVSISTKGEQQEHLVFHHGHSTNPLATCPRETAALVGYQAALSNASAALDGAEESTALQVYTDARNGIHSQSNLHLEYDRIREVRQCAAEEVFDLVTSDHHFIAEGVVVHNCDIRINNDLEKEGYSFEAVEWCWKDQSVDVNGRLSEEEIYELLMQQQPPPPPAGSWGNPDNSDGDSKGDMVPAPAEDLHGTINNVVKAMQQAKLAGAAGSIPGELEQIIDKFLTPIVPWEQHLHEFFTELCDEDFSWARPNRRHLHDDLYLPSMIKDEGKLEHLAYYLDVSGSISDQDVLRFNSEVKYIKEKFNPLKLTLVLFDTRITAQYVFEENDRFEKIVVVGRGGTSLVPVREHIEQHRPTAAVIFSDLDCPAMKPLDHHIPVIWIAVNAAGKTVPFGKLIHIRS